jgi:hypothetical protein
MSFTSRLSLDSRMRGISFTAASRLAEGEGLSRAVQKSRISKSLFDLGFFETSFAGLSSLTI